MAEVVLKTTICLAACGYVFLPAPYKACGNLAAERTEQVFKVVSEHDTTKAVAGGLRSILKRLPKRMRPSSVDLYDGGERQSESDAAPGAAEGSSFSSSSDAEDDTLKTLETSPLSFFSGSSSSTPATPMSPASTSSGYSDDELDTEPATPVWPYSFPDEASPERNFHEPEILYGPWDPHQRPRVSKAEVDKMLQAILERRTLRHEAMQRRTQRYQPGNLTISPQSEKKKGKKTVRFALDTKPGSVENSSNPDEKLLSPLPPPNSELALFTTALSVPDGSLFTHPNDFDEAALIRKLPSQMKNGAGGLAYCRGRTENGLYMLDPPAGRMLLDLRAGVCYDARDGRMMGSEEVMAWMLWGRGEVEERWGGFRWRRGLEEGTKK